MQRWRGEELPVRRPKVAWREVDDEIFVCSPDGEVMHTLRGVAADIWRAIDGQNSVQDILELLLAAYEVDRATLAGDLAECLSNLEEKSLISSVDT